MTEEFKTSDGESTLFEIDWEAREVRTLCGDFYYDYSIGFEEIKRLNQLIIEKEEV